MMRVEEETNLVNRGEPKCPLLVRFASVIFPFYAFGFALGVVEDIFGFLTEAYDSPVFRIHGEAVNNAGLGIAVFGGGAILFGSAGYALIRKRRWARVPIVLIAPFMILISVAGSWMIGRDVEFLRSLVPLLFVSWLVGWYLFEKDNVVEYFDSQ